jgi:2,4-dienoyl-CoA reductase-like NADH-dependent reductase (Old Yellow Enzyme family)
MANDIAEEVAAPVAAVGLITDSKQAEKILQTTDVEIIMIARLSLRDPYWPLRAAHELGVEVDYWPNQYVRGTYPA